MHTPDYYLQHVKGWLSQEQAWLLFNLARNSFGHVVDIGTYHGLSALIMGSAIKNDPHRCVYTIDDYSSTGVNGISFSSKDMLAAYRNLADADACNVRMLTVSSQAAWELFGAALLTSPGLIFIDGSHTYEDVFEDVHAWSSIMARGSTIACHDYELEGVKKAVDEFLAEEGKTDVKHCGNMIYWTK